MLKSLIDLHPPTSTKPIASGFSFSLPKIQSCLEISMAVMKVLKKAHRVLQVMMETKLKL